METTGQDISGDFASATALDEAVEGAAEVTQEKTTINLKDVIDDTKLVPFQGIWFRVAKVDGPYVMLKAFDLTSKRRRELLG
jgi:hypothetical protein